MNYFKEKIINEFSKYVKNFDINIEKIKLKYHHSIRVMEFAEKLAISENLSNDEIEIAMIIGLLHDYGRFEQWTNYQTFNDLDSIDHGDLAVEILFDKNNIEKFYNKKENYDVIYQAIKYHNKYDFPEDVNNLTKTMCKIIRDADKLDIMNLYVNNIVKIEYSDEEISEEVRNQFLNNKLISRKNVKNFNDKNLLRMALLYDYNYDFSYEYTIENNILDRLYEKINNPKIFKEYYFCMKNFLEKKLK